MTTSWLNFNTPLNLGVVDSIQVTFHSNRAGHWRPISLLNTDYKILSRILANRITPILSKIISNNQKCGVPGRKIDQILFNIQAVFEIAKQIKEKFSLMLIDFKKAFNRLSHQFIFKIFQEPGFGKMMLECTKIPFLLLN